MADAHPNSSSPAVDQIGMAKKKNAKEPRKPQAECTPEEIAKLDAKSAKRRNRRAAVEDNAATRKFAAERNAMEAARRKIEVEEKQAIVYKAHALLMLGICRPAWVPPARPLAVCRRKTDSFWRLTVLPPACCVAGEQNYSFWRLTVLPAAGFIAVEDV
ncbi:putative DBINO protein [Hordeum vulgare]|nr:putative DBINO protein [Hordeum vulgare]